MPAAIGTTEQARKASLQVAAHCLSREDLLDLLHALGLDDPALFVDDFSASPRFAQLHQ